jgi:hypothetical protein
MGVRLDPQVLAVSLAVVAFGFGCGTDPVDGRSERERRPAATGCAEDDPPPARDECPLYNGGRGAC